MKSLYASLLVGASLLSGLLVLTPVELLQHDVAQTARGLELAFDLHRWNRLLTPLLLAIGLVAIRALWSRVSSLVVKLGMIVLALGMVASVVTAWSNTLEWRYRPMGELEFVSTGGADHLSDEDMVLSVSIGGETRAYSVRQLIYHHVINDVVSGVPIAVTF